MMKTLGRNLPIDLAGWPAILAAIIAGTAPAAHAGTVIASFNDNTAGTFAGQFGGTGFASSSPWAVTVGGGGVNVVAGDLTAPASTGYSLAQNGAGQQLYSTGSSTILSRPIANGGLTSSQTVWFSFLGQVDSGGRAGICIDDPQNSPYNRVLLRTGTTATGTGVQLYVDPSVSLDLPGTTSLVGSSILVVGRLSLNTSGSSDTLDVWVNPNLNSTSLFNTAVGAGQATLSGMDWDTASTGATTSGIQYLGVLAYAGGHLDNVVMSDDPNAYSLVTGIQPVPEPSAIALFGIGLGAVALVRRSRKV